MRNEFIRRSGLGLSSLSAERAPATPAGGRARAPTAPGAASSARLLRRPRERGAGRRAAPRRMQRVVRISLFYVTSRGLCDLFLMEY